MKNGFWAKNPSLSIKEFRYFLSIRFGLIFSLNMQSTIIFYWIYHITNDKLALGLVGLAEVIPAICCSFFAGHLVDLSEKRRMVLFCIASYIVIGCSLFALTTPFAFGRLGVSSTQYLIYAFVFLGGITRAFMGPSVFSLFGLVMPREHFPNATSWSSMAWQTGAMLGPLAAGLAIAINSITTGMFAVILIQIILLIPILSIKRKPILKKEKEPVLQSLTQGIRFVLKTPALLGAQLLDMFSVLFGGAVALLPVYQKEILHVDEVGFGLLRSAPGVGALVTLVLLAFILIVGPTLFIVELGVEGVGHMLQNFIRMGTYTDAAGTTNFVEAWTVFYWAWWLALGPYMGVFITKISRGRTLRELILGGIGYGTLGCVVFFAILGNYALYLEMNQLFPVIETLNSAGAPAAIVGVLGTLPLSSFAILIFTFVCIIFAATSYDSASYTLAASATKSLVPEDHPAREHRVFWAFLLGLLPITLVYMGGLKPLQSAVTLASVPLYVVTVILTISLWRSIHAAEQASSGNEAVSEAS